MKSRITYLLEIDIIGTTIRFASNGDTVNDGKTYLDGLSVQSVSDAELRCSLPNYRHQGAALFLNHPVREKPVRLYVLINDVKTLKFSGMGDSLTKLTNAKAEIRAVALFGESQFPNAPIAPPVFNHITPTGTMIQFGGQTLEID